MRVNLGCGEAYVEGWVNVDSSPDVRADVHADAFEFVRDHAPEIDEVYLGHVVEHLLPDVGHALLRLLCERLRPGTQVSAVVPDMRAIFAAYEAGEISNEELNDRYVYSYEQPCHHAWCYDLDSLTDLFRRAGFLEVEPIDPLTWPPVWWKEGPESRWQCGVRGVATGSAAEDGHVPAPVVGGEAEDEAEGAAAEGRPAGDTPLTTEAALLVRIRRLRQELRDVAEMERELDLVKADRDLANAHLEDLARQLEQLRSSPLMAAGARARRAVARALPADTPRGRAARAAAQTLRELRALQHRMRDVWKPAPQAPAEEPPTYERWCRTHDADAFDIDRQARQSRRAARPMRGAVVVAAGPGWPGLEATLGSVRGQSWEHWSALVLAPSGGAPEAGAGSADRRVRWLPSPDGPDPWAGVNGAVVQAEDADFVVFLEAGETLAPDCLYHVAAQARQDSLVDLVTWDDDQRAPDGSRSEPRFRPSWSPETLLGADYLGRSFAIRRIRFLVAGGVRDELGPARFWDLLLRSGLDEERVARVPRVLAHVRSRPDTPGEEGLRAVRDHLAARGLSATAELAGGCVRVRWPLDDAPHVTVIVPTRHNRPLLERGLGSLAATDYPSFDVVVVDNGDRTDENERWYPETFPGLDLTVEWWDRPFNYSAVNNLGATRAKGDVLVFLNDDVEILDPGWMAELVGWALRPEIGVVGLQLVGADGRLQHAGAVLGLNGFADHLFEGLYPGEPTLLGPTGWYRNALAVTAACLALRRELFEQVGGFDERFLLCGSDVTLGLDARRGGRRNLCTPFGRARHLGSATRGASVPAEDFFTSYWRYQYWLFGGDPYFSPNLSLERRVPELRWPSEPTPADRLAEPLGRRFEVFRQKTDQLETTHLTNAARATEVDVRAVKEAHAAEAAAFEVRTVNWFIPDIDSPFYGGVNTALRIADLLARNHGVENRFVVLGGGPEPFVRSALAAAFPALADSPVVVTQGRSLEDPDHLPAADAAVATLWVTAYSVARFPGARRHFYLVQDFEPMFYPAGSLYAVAEETYRLGLYGLCNTENLLDVYRGYGGKGTSFTPAVDPAVFHARDRHQRTPDAPVTVFVYARPGHWRNCWELAFSALEKLKRRLGDRVRILAAGSWAVPEPGDLPFVKHLGLLDYRATGELYRRCDVGLALTVSRHPSYLPLELMACGVPVVALDNPYGHWLLRDEENALLSARTPEALADDLERLVIDPGLRRRLAARGRADVERSHSSWADALSGIYGYLCDPEGQGAAASPSA